MIKTVLTTTAAFALMTGMAFAQAKTDGGTQRSAASPTSGNSGVSLSTGQTQPLQAGSYSTNPQTPGLNSVSGSATGGPGSNPNGGPSSGTVGSGPTSSTTTSASTMPASTMPTSTMPAAPTMVANTPAGDAPSTYPKCTHKGQDRCMQRMAAR